MEFMQEALKQAKKAYKKDEVPIGAVIVKNDKIIAKAYNKREHSSATYHAEILAINKACKKLKDFRLIGCDIYVTLEPCAMCMGAILNARIEHLYFGAYAKSDAKGNILSSEEINERAGLNHKTVITGGILQNECTLLITDYFKQKRINNKL